MKPTNIDGVQGWRRLALGVVGSTNVEALNLANDSDTGRLWVTATQQLQGKARRGRSWESPPGNLFATCLLIDLAPPEKLATLPLVASLALHKALSFDPALEKQLKIKWPNDLLLDGKKISGILLEAVADKFGRQAVIIGFGINCEHFPDNPLYPTTSLANAGFSIKPEDLFPRLAAAVAENLRIWAEGAGFAVIRREWLDRAAGMGSPITARFPDREISGKFMDIDADGFLLLEDAKGTVQHISAADIFFANPSSKSA